MKKAFYELGQSEHHWPAGKMEYSWQNDAHHGQDALAEAAADFLQLRALVFLTFKSSYEAPGKNIL